MEKEMIKKNKEGKEYLTFENWEEIKLISYWYNETLLFLTLIAKYIKGMVEWEFENKDEAGQIEFDGGECKITTGQMNYAEWNSKENLDIKKLNPRLKKLMIVDGLK